MSDVKGVRYDVSPLGPGPNWVTHTTPVEGVGLYVRAIAHALMRHGHTESEAIAIALGAVKRWAKGGGNVKPSTRAKAAAAVAHWDRLKAIALGKDVVKGKREIEFVTAEELLERAARHKPGEPQNCKYGSHPATKSLIWAEGAAYVPVCNEHESTAVNKIGGPNEVDKVIEIRAPEELWHESTGPSPKGSEADFVDHMIRRHHFVGGGTFYLTRDALTRLHTFDHDQHGETGAHDETVTGQRGVAEWGAGGPPAAAGSGTSTGASDLLPVGPTKKVADDVVKTIGPHRFTGSDLSECSVCGKGVAHSIHRRRTAGVRHAGPDHEPVPTGHRRGAMRRHMNRAKLLHEANMPKVEDPLRDAVHEFFEKQREGTLSRLHGKRGKTMLKRATQPPDDHEPRIPPAGAAAGSTPSIPASDEAGADAAGSDVAPSINPESIFQSDFWIQKLTDLIYQHLKISGELAADQVKQQVHAQHDLDDHDSLKAVDQILKDRARTSAVQVNNTTKKAIFEALQQGVAEGTGMAGLAKRVNAVFDHAAGPRARMIAQTETVGSLNQAAHTYAANLPKDVVGTKTWLAHHDDRTRLAHRLTDGQRQPVDKPYMVTGYPMMYPGDPVAPPDLVINCRCGQAFLPPDMTTKSFHHDLTGLVPQSTLDALEKMDLKQAQNAKLNYGNLAPKP